MHNNTHFPIAYPSLPLLIVISSIFFLFSPRIFLSLSLQPTTSPISRHSLIHVREACSPPRPIIWMYQVEIYFD